MNTKQSLGAEYNPVLTASKKAVEGSGKPLQHFCLENLNEEYDSMNKIGCFLKFYFIDSILLLNLRLEGLVIKIF